MKDSPLQVHLGKRAVPQQGTQAHLSSADQFVRNHLFLVSGILVLTYVLGILAYGEPFLLSQYAISDLGATVTKHGLPNTSSRIIMTIGMLICSSLMLRVGLARSLRQQWVKRWLALLCAAGFFLFICPLDINYTIHSIGAALIIGPLYLLDNCFLWEQRQHMPAIVFWLAQVILQTTVLTYAVAFTTTAAIKQISQKFCIAGLLIVSFLSLRDWNGRNKGNHRRLETP